jgi:hypothetical protein
VGHFIFAPYQFIFRFQPLACIDNYLSSPSLDMWAGRCQPINDYPGDPEQKQSDHCPIANKKKGHK